MPVPVIAIFDVGKTNKKVVLFDEYFKPVLEETNQFPEATDEDGFPCENLAMLKTWIKNVFERLIADRRFIIQCVNFSGYGASLVYLDKNGRELSPLYNYLKPFPGFLQQQFFEKYGDPQLLARQTASPVLGSLNAGMQLYRMKYEQPQIFEKIRYALHLPQYLSYVLTEVAASDITSIGCHTMLWDFEKQTYHDWVKREGNDKKLAPVMPSSTVIPFEWCNRQCKAGIGIHDSSAALIPYSETFQEPFVLLSTGTWCISLNPFNVAPLTSEELRQDCLCYFSFKGQPVKASRVFLGYKHEQMIKHFADYFHKPLEYYKKIVVNLELLNALSTKTDFQKKAVTDDNQAFVFPEYDLTGFESYEEAYHRFMIDLVRLQCRSTDLILNNTSAKKIYVDGGFSNNDLFMRLLATAFSGIKVFSAEIPRASAIGAAMAVHWQKEKRTLGIISVKPYSKLERLSKNLFD